MSYPQSSQKPPLDTYLVASPVPGRNRLRLLDCKTVLQCCARDVGRAGFRGAVVGAIFLQRAVFFDVDVGAGHGAKQGKAQRCRVYLNKLVYKHSNSS